MKVNTQVRPIVFVGEGGERIALRRSNMGEPYRDGVDFDIQTDCDEFGAFLEVQELRRMRDFLNKYIGDE